MSVSCQSMTACRISASVLVAGSTKCSKRVVGIGPSHCRPASESWSQNDWFCAMSAREAITSRSRSISGAQRIAAIEKNDVPCRDACSWSQTACCAGDSGYQVPDGLAGASISLATSGPDAPARR
ncbi:hypothetical protein BAR24066_07386 [Burkholderia arboris]|uniref:Uncharacterized protein n=1 Tax=Burkholderia arboris TaxID=488730 RepID=A0A9Q9SRN9_9BURK|nr:hypothetical protein BAR24066_07386 [Burkholderia arboris]